jgi:prepilin-type N-terminal cleavage/methylation domain-containing protein
MTIKNNKKAFTLIEVLFAMLILSIGFPIIFSSYQFCLSALSKLSETTTANTLMEKVYNDLNIQIMTNNFEMPTLEASFEEPYENYSYKMELLLVAFDDFDGYALENDGNLYDVTISVLQEGSDNEYNCITRIYLPESTDNAN